MAYANLTATADTMFAEGEILSLKMDAVKIYKGSILTADASAGYASWGNVDTGCVASRPFLGIATETVDNSAGAAGAKSIKAAITGVHTFVCTGADQTWVGTVVYLDVATAPNVVVNATPGIGPAIGRVTEFISSTSIRVRIDGYAFNVDGAAS